MKLYALKNSKWGDYMMHLIQYANLFDQHILYWAQQCPLNSQYSPPCQETSAKYQIKTSITNKLKKN